MGPGEPHDLSAPLVSVCLSFNAVVALTKPLASQNEAPGRPLRSPVMSYPQRCVLRTIFATAFGKQRYWCQVRRTSPLTAIGDGG